MKFTFELPWSKPNQANSESAKQSKSGKAAKEPKAVKSPKTRTGKKKTENFSEDLGPKAGQELRNGQKGPVPHGFQPFQPFPMDDAELSNAILTLTGYSPKNLAIYQEALHHASLHTLTKEGQKWNNERLEFLGDAVIDLVLADQLYERFPGADEGFLTELRAKVVSTKKLDELAKSLGVPTLLHFDTRNQTLARTKTIFADALEAIIGALFRDHGYEATRKFVTERVVLAHLDLELLSNTETNHKSKVFEWAQREQRELKFVQVEDEGIAPVGRKFVMALVVDGKEITRATDFNKKAAEQRASALFCEKLEAGWGVKVSKKKKSKDEE